MDYLVVYSDK